VVGASPLAALRRIPMSTTLFSISCTAPDVYEVVLEMQNGRSAIFKFEVESRDIDVVKWSSQFAAYMQQNLGPASPLLEAILQFHRARRVEFP
jgi:hypothetical protein